MFGSKGGIGEMLIGGVDFPAVLIGVWMMRLVGEYLVMCKKIPHGGAAGFSRAG
jgi:hypothetical protein